MIRTVAFVFAAIVLVAGAAHAADRQLVRDPSGRKIGVAERPLLLSDHQIVYDKDGKRVIAPRGKNGYTASRIESDVDSRISRKPGHSSEDTDD